jgi:hypothetical protein
MYQSCVKIGVTIILFIGIAGCEPANVPDTPLPDSHGTHLHATDRFRVRIPIGTGVQEIAPSGERTGGLRLSGPGVSIENESGGEVAATPFFRMEIFEYANPEGLSSEQWAARWMEGPGGALVRHHSPVLVGGHPAYLVETFGGALTIQTYFVSSGSYTFALVYEAPDPALHALAPAAGQIVSMIIATFQPNHDG